MSEKSFFRENFDSIMTLDDKFHNSCHKCKNQIACSRENFSIYSKDSVSTIIEDNEQCQSVRPLVEKEDEKTSTHHSICEKSNGIYTENEINEFIRIIEDALYEETSRGLSKKSSSEKSASPTCQLYSHENNICHNGNDDISLCVIGSLVLDQYSLIRKCEADHLLSSSADLDLHESVVESESSEYSSCQSLSQSEDFQFSCKRSKNDREKYIYQNSDAEDRKEICHDEHENICNISVKKNNSLISGNDDTKNWTSTNEINVRRKSPVKCKLRDSSVFTNLNEYSNELGCEDVEKFVIENQGKSDLIGKWGYLEIVDKVLSESDVRNRSRIDLSEKNSSTYEKFIDELNDEKTLSCIHYDEHEDEYLPIDVCGLDMKCHLASKICKSEIDVEKFDENKRKHCREIFNGVCVVANDNFDDLTRFKKIGQRGVASLCRNLSRWTHCVTKTLCDLRQYPHIVIHIPSFSYPKSLRIRAKVTFQNLQNIQFGRLAWLANKNTQVIYVCPDLNGNELEHYLRELIGRVRPDICLKNLWIIKSKDFSRTNNFGTNGCSSGIENLFTNPHMYRRLRNLTAGRQSFILPGVMQETDVFVACELKIPIMGISLACQKRLGIKSEFIKLLREFIIDHPPSLLDVKDSHELYKGLARMMIEFPDHDTWLVKMNVGFDGCHTAVLKFHTASVNEIIMNECQCRLEKEEKLTKLFMEKLPAKLELNSEVYENFKRFAVDLEHHGGMIQACPRYSYKTLSLGIIIEHDTALPNLLVAAEVVKFKDDIRNDVGYIIPQNVVATERLNELTRKIGMALRREGMVGFFGIDLVAFTNKFNVQELWVVDMDPYYTNLQAFSEWINFCLNSEQSCNIISSMERKVTPENVGEYSGILGQIIDEISKNSQRFTVTSAKLRSNGLSRYSGNTLVALCKDRHVYYDPVEKRGCMLCPVDPSFHDICLISIYPTRQLAIKKFVEALRVLHEISIDKMKCPKTNILKLAREMSQMESSN